MRKALLGQLSEIDFRLLRIFRSVVENSGLSAAELELNIARSTISRHLKDLETRLGMTLCYRGRGGFSLTKEGEQVYQQTLQLLNAVESFRNHINDLNENMRGSITLALFDKTVTNPKSKIHQAIKQFNQQAPDVAIEIHIAPLNDIEQGVIEGRFHIGIIPQHRPSTSLSYLPLFEESMGLYCSTEHPLAKNTDNATNIQQYQYAGLGYHSPNMDISNQHRLTRHATAYDQEGIATLILSGQFIGYLPEHYATIFLQQGSIEKVNKAEFDYSCLFSAITRLSPKPSRIVNTFLNALEQTLI